MCDAKNMPKKIVIKVRMSGKKCRAKALKIAAETDGVNSMAIKGEDELVVTGDGIDSATLACKLRKKLGFANIHSVEEEKTKSKEEKPEPIPAWIPSICYSYPPTCQGLAVCDPNPSTCSIL